MWSTTQPPAMYFTAVSSGQSIGNLAPGIAAGAVYNHLDGALWYLTDADNNQSGDIDIPTAVEAIRELISTSDWRAADSAAIAAGIPNGVRSIGGFAGYSYTSSKTNDPDTGISSLASISIRENIASFDGTGAGIALPDIPLPLSSLVQGVDYDANPVTGKFVNYFGTVGSFQGWSGINGSVGDWQPLVYRVGASSDNTSMQLLFRCMDYNDTLSGEVSDLFYQVVDGFSLATIDYDPTLGDVQQFTVPLSGIHSQKFSLIVMPGQMADQSFTEFANYPVPAIGSTDSRNGTNFVWVSQSLSGYGAPQVFVVYQTPPWQYWIPSPGSGPIPPPLRLNQRDDGLGSTAGHARLITGQPNGCQSGQLMTAPRIGTSNIYDPGHRPL